MRVFRSRDAIRDSREAPRSHRLEESWNDLRYAFRSFARTPVQTCIVILLLGISIGISAALVSLVGPLLLQDIPGETPEDLFEIALIQPDGRAVGRSLPWSFPAYQEFREEFEAGEVAAHSGGRPAPMDSTTGGAASGLSDLGRTFASRNYFTVLGVEAMLGRVFTGADGSDADPDPVFVLSHRAWRRLLGGDPDVIGRSYDIGGGHRLTLIGVMPRDFQGVNGDLWVPLGMAPELWQPNVLTDSQTASLLLTGRLRPGYSATQAEAGARVVYAQMQSFRFPGNPLFGNPVLVLEPLVKFATLRGQQISSLYLWTAGVAALMLIACANVAGLLVVRAAARRRETAVRQALGCGRGRLFRQFLVEGLVLAGSGGLLGCMLAYAGANALLVMVAPEAMSMIDVWLDPGTLLFTLSLTLAMGLLFGLAPLCTTGEVIELRNSQAGNTNTASGGRLNRWWVGLESALSFVLLTLAVLFGQSLYRLYTIDPGFEARNVLSVRVAGDGTGFGPFTPSEDRISTLAGPLVDTLSTLPGVDSAGISGMGPLTGLRAQGSLRIAGEDPEPRQVLVDHDRVSADYFRTLGVPIVSGRSFASYDRPGAVPVAIVNEAFVRAYLPGGEALGRRLVLGGDEAEVVGVAADYRRIDVREEPAPFVYRPVSQESGDFLSVLVRTEGPPLAMVPAVREAIAGIGGRRLRVQRIETLGDLVAGNLRQDIVLARLSGFFGLIAIALACAGVYGMMSHLVVTRTREIGIRLALGAQPSAVRRRLIADGLQAVVVGLIAGVAAALALERYVESSVYGFVPADPVTYLAGLVLLTLASLLAAFVPTRRASRLDPVRILNTE